MAYCFTENGVTKGPFPCDAGEYCGNYHPDTPFVSGFDEDHATALKHHNQWLSKMRFGRPRSCAAGSSEEMAKKGFVGLYLKESGCLPPTKDAYRVKTPSELMEPGAL